MNDLSQAFASAFFFRILLPGLVLAVGLHPLIGGLPQVSTMSAMYPGGGGVLFLAEVTCFGLIAYTSTTPVRHCALGLTLPLLTKPARLLNAWKFDRKYAAFTAAYGDKSYDDLDQHSVGVLQQLNVFFEDYPIERERDGSTRYGMPHATRVGNIIATYERYPDTRYGLNAEAFWNHFLFVVPTEVRHELDSAHATADGTLLAAAAGWVVVGVCVCLAAGLFIGWIYHGFVIAALPVTSPVLVSLFVYGLGAALLFNLLSRVMHREYGRLYRACFDVHIKDFTDWLDAHEPVLAPAQIALSESFRKYASALVRLDGGNTSDTAESGTIKPDELGLD